MPSLATTPEARVDAMTYEQRVQLGLKQLAKVGRLLALKKDEEAYEYLQGIAESDCRDWALMDVIAFRLRRGDESAFELRHELQDTPHRHERDVAIRGLMVSRKETRADIDAVVPGSLKKAAENPVCTTSRKTVAAKRRTPKRS